VRLAWTMADEIDLSTGHAIDVKTAAGYLPGSS
jgi:hypothetical protein